jgi:hypothetical protein
VFAARRRGAGAAAACYFTTAFDGLSSGNGPGSEQPREAGLGDEASAGADAAGAPGVDASDFCADAAFCDRFERSAVKGPFDLEPTPQRLTVTIDDTTVVDRQALRHDYAPTAPRLDGAVPYAQEGAAYAIDVDDVRVDVTP